MTPPCSIFGYASRGTSQYRPWPRTAGASASESATMPGVGRAALRRTAASARCFRPAPVSARRCRRCPCGGERPRRRGRRARAAGWRWRCGGPQGRAGRWQDRAAKMPAPTPRACRRRRRRRSRRGRRLLHQSAGILDVGGEEQVEGRAVADLGVEIAGGSVVDGEGGLGMPLVELAGGVGQGELQVGRGGDGELVGRGGMAAGGAQEREQGEDGGGESRYHFCKTMVAYRRQCLPGGI